MAGLVQADSLASAREREINREKGRDDGLHTSGREYTRTCQRV
jgi:hypothetical protein